MQDSFNWDDNTAINIRTYARALHEREEKCQKAPTYGVLKVDLRKSCNILNKVLNEVGIILSALQKSKESSYDY